MKIIITAGGTSEKIDDVRTISNISSGRLALCIALKICQHLPDSEISFIASSAALKPHFLIPRINVLQAENAMSLLDKLNLLKTEKPVAIIHSMAVSDFRPDFRSGKISSGTEDLCINLKSNPKIIKEIKNIFPKALLFGFKLESAITKEELTKRGLSLLTGSNSDYVIMNLVDEISLFFHKGYIMDKHENLDRFYSKNDCGLKIANILKRRPGC